ncbi:ATPase, partial [Geobacillus stearothermophilus]|nr:ATPase [Geobacillus stearothermophilus]
VYELVPIGSTGIYYVWMHLSAANGRLGRACACPLPLFASGGPATSFLISYDRAVEGALRKRAGRLFFPLFAER